MGIYLCGIEMPKDGEMLVIFPDGTAYVCFNGMREPLAKAGIIYVPPHGRLMDIDAPYEIRLSMYGKTNSVDVYGRIILPADPPEEGEK